MSYKQWIKSVVIATVGVVSPMWGSCPLSFIDGTIAPSPMTYHGDANMTLTPYIVGSGVSASDGFGPSCTFKIELSKVDIKDNDLSNLITTAAEPAGSDVLDYFTLTTTVLANGHTELRFAQKADLPDDWYAAMLINLDVTGESTSAEVQNSFQANVVGNANESSKQTYTTSPILIAVSDSNNSVNGDTGGVAIANIFVNDTINGEAVVMGTDVRLQTITTDTILEINTTSGEVSVPAATTGGTYIETYTLCDNTYTDVCSEATITVHVANNLPDARNDLNSTPEDTEIDLPVLSNDTDTDGDTLSIQSFTQPANGSISDNGNGTLKYVPNPNYNGVDTFTYIITDGNGGTDTATVTVTVAAVNDAPIAVDDLNTTPEDTEIDLTVLDNDPTDLDGDTLSIQDFSQAENGIVTDNGDGTLKYAPNPNYYGTDAFTYVITDGNGGTDTATVTIIVTAVNDAPIAVDDINTTSEDTAIELPVLGNDTDIDGDTLSIQSFTQPNNGIVTDNGNGTLKYVPNLNYHGIDTFTYVITDGNGETDTATVTIRVIAVNDAPIAIDDLNTTSEDTEIDLSILGNDTDIDGDTLSIQSFTQPNNGIVTDNGNGTLKYVPSPNYYGTDTFTYVITDGNGGTDTATVTINVSMINDEPIANNDTSITPEDHALNIAVSINDEDEDGDDLTVASFTQPDNGIVTKNADGTLKYVPNLNYHGIDTFTYMITDGNGGTDTATVTITVTAVNDAPIAVDDLNTTPEDTEIDLPILGNDTDSDGDTLSILNFTKPNNGIVTENADGTLKYIPDNNFHGTDMFTYTISDGELTDTAIVTITVSAINDLPIAVDDNSSTIMNEDKVLTLTDIVISNDRDPDSDTLTISAVGNATHGTIVLNADGTVTFTPEHNYVGIGTFEYTISDGHAGTDTATVTIDILTILPEYELILDVTPTIITVENSPMDILLQITEYDRGINSGDLIIFLSKDVTTNINFDSTLSTLGGRTLSNSEWEYKKTPVGYQFKYIANGGKFPSYNRLYIGLKAVFSTPINVVGKIPVNVQILNGSGDKNILNNVDAISVSHSYIIN